MSNPMIQEAIPPETHEQREIRMLREQVESVLPTIEKLFGGAAADEFSKSWPPVR